MDLARFTTISEALGQIGSAGTERLVSLINRFFTPAIDTAYSLGGDVVGFGGDALTVVFPAGRIKAAGTWAIEVMSVVDALDVIDTPSGRFRLEAKIGIGEGTHGTHLIGTGADRRAVTGGTAIDNAVLAEGSVAPGEIGLLVRPDHIPRSLADHEGVTILDGHRADIAPVDDRDPAAAVWRVAEEEIWPFVPDRVIDRYITAGPELLDEHRPATVLFVSLGEESIHADPELLPHLATAMEIVDAHRGSVLSIGSGDKGTTLLATFGAPVAFSGQRSAAIFAANEITGSVPSSSGVATGLCFCGRVGSARRWSYTLIGDVVNTAARLMAKAPPGRVLVDEATYHAAHPALIFDSAGDERLKGKESPVRAALLNSTDGDTEIGNDLPLAGRSAELQELGTRLDEVATSGSATFVVGESGVGKSRLVRELVEIASHRGFRIAEIDLTNRRSARSYGPWQPVVFAVLGLGEDAGPAEFRAAVLDRFGSDTPLASIVRGVVLGDGEPGGALVGVDAKQAAEILDAALTELILRDGEQPLLLIADDVHDLDEASTRLLDQIRQRARRASVVLVGMGYPDSEAATWDWDHTLYLTNLAAPEALELAVDHQRKTAVDVDESVLAEIVERVGGNPQLVRLLIDYAASGADELPNDARSIVLARYDRLEVGAREALAMASVLGRHFLRSDFLGAFQDRLSERRPLDDLIAERLVEPIGHDAFSFASPLLHQVAYEASSYASRTEAHRDVGLHIERLPSTGADQRVEDLAHHFSYTEDRERHRRYFGPAGRRAQRAFANENAVEWLLRAIDVADGAEAGSLRFDLATTLEHVGRWEEATAALNEAAADERVGPRALASLAQLQLLTDNFDHASELLDRAVAGADALGDPLVSEWVFEKASLVHTHAGRYERAAELAADQLAAAELLGDKLRIAAALSNSGAAKSWTGDLAPARRELMESLEIFLDMGALGMATDTEMDLAMVALDEGNVEECLERLRTTHDRAKSIGHRRAEASASGNLALALLGEGDVALAWPPAMASASLLVELGDIATASGTFGLLGVLTMAADDHESAIGLISRTIHIGRRLGSSAYRDRAYDDLADAYEALGEAKLAQLCRDQQAAEETDLSDAEVDEVASLTPPSEMAIGRELMDVLAAADELIAGLGGTSDD